MLHISPSIRAKLASKHGVRTDEVAQCFENVEGKYLRDDREQHQSDPPTLWFIAETNQRRLLKIVFVLRTRGADGGEDPDIFLRTAYEPNASEIAIYEKYGK